MSAAWIIYFGGMVDGLKTLTLILGIILLVATVFHVPFLEVSSKDDRGRVLSSAKRFIAACLFAFAVNIVVPKENTIYLMAGAKVTEDIVKSPEAKEIGGKILKVINEKLDEQMKEKK